jgi:hypothetical protein
MIAEIHKQEPAMIPLAMDPSRQANGPTDMLRAELAAGVRPVGVHRENAPDRVKPPGSDLIDGPDKRMPPSGLSI